MVACSKAVAVLVATLAATSSAFRLQDSKPPAANSANWLTDLVKTVQHNVERKAEIEKAVQESKKSAEAKHVFYPPPPKKAAAPAAAKKIEEPKKAAPVAAKKVEEPKKAAPVAVKVEQPQKPVISAVRKVEETKKVEEKKAVPTAAPVAAKAQEPKPVVPKVEEHKEIPKPVEVKAVEVQKPAEAAKPVEVQKPVEKPAEKTEVPPVQQAKATESKVEEAESQEDEEEDDAAATKLAEDEAEAAEKVHHRTVSKYEKYLTDQHVAAKVARAKEAVQEQRKMHAKVEHARQEAQKEALKRRMAEKVAAAPVPAFVTTAPPSRPGTMRLSVIDGRNQGVQITVAKTATVKVLAQAAIKRFGLEGKGATFWRRGKQLLEDERLETYGLQDLDAVDIYSH